MSKFNKNNEQNVNQNILFNNIRSILEQNSSIFDIFYYQSNVSIVFMNTHTKFFSKEKFYCQA